MSNLRSVDAAGGRTFLRCLLLAGENSDSDHIGNIALLYSELTNVTGLELLPYHSLGVSKYERLGIEKPPKDEALIPDREHMVSVYHHMTSMGIPCII